MARNKEFDFQKALDGATEVFREHGFDGTSTDMLVKSMKIGRQSLYDTYGDKWRLYCASVQNYAVQERQAHLEVLGGGRRAIEGIRAMIDRVVATAALPCLGVNSVCEFGQSHAELNKIHAAAGSMLSAAMIRRIQEAQSEGDMSPDIVPEHASSFLQSSFAGIRIAARGGADPETLRALGSLALRALE